jgi:hypothetical protein
MTYAYPTADAKTAGEEISSTHEGRHVSVLESQITHPSHTDGFVDKGDPCLVGNVLVGVAFKSAAAATDLIALDTEGIWVQDVYAANGAGNSAVAYGDELYIDPTTCAISKIATGRHFGYALGIITGGNTDTIAVKVHFDPLDDDVEDDVQLKLGSLQTSAATMVTIEMDETTTGIGLYEQGTSGVPMVLNTNPGAAVIANQIHINHSAGAGDCDDLIAAYQKVTVSGDGDSGLTAVGTAPRLTISGAAQEGYCLQSHVIHESDDGILALSAGSFRLTTRAANFTATNSVNAGQFILTGDGTYNPTCTAGRFTGVEITVESYVSGVDAVLRLNNAGTSTDCMIEVQGGAATYLMEVYGTTIVENADITSGKSCVAGARCYINGAVGVIPFYED